MYQTKITSQGTISLPAALREKHGLKPGETVTIEDGERLTIYKLPTFAELREMNKKYVKKATGVYKSGDGIAQHVKEKYGT